MLINKALPGLFNGVSQQSASLRLDTQCELSENVYPSVSEGSSKRPPTEHLAILSSKAAASSFVHVVNRDSTERYIMILTGDADEPVEVYTLAGVKCTVVADAAGKAYLTSTNPLADFRATTAADYTLIANTTKVGAMSSVVSLVDKPAAIIYVAKGVAAQTYNVILNGEVAATYTAGDTTAYDSYRSQTIATSLFNSIVVKSSNHLAINFDAATPALDGSETVSLTLGGAVIGSAVPYTIDSVSVPDEGSWFVHNPEATATAFCEMVLANINTAAWSVFRVGSMVYIKKAGATTFAFTVTGGSPGIAAPSAVSPWDVDYVAGTNAIRVTKLDGTDFGFSVNDSYGNQALIGIKGKAQKFGDLPSTCFDGTRVEITGEPTNNFDNFHLMYSSDGSQSTGVWKEVAKQGLKNAFDPATLPHQLTRTAFNTFTLSPITWMERRVGDDNSNPPASFIGSKIKDIFFYRNRLGFLAGENVILSKSGEFFDFWSTTATTVLDHDPIDISCPSDEVTELLHAIPFPKSLFLVGAQQQFALNSGSLNMTPKTVAVDAVTHFEVSPLCHPVVSGSNVYLSVPKGNYTSIREYYISPDTFSTDAADVTSHIPTYIPKNVSRLSSSSAFDVLVALSQDTPDTLYVYKYYWSGDQKAQSAWGKWVIEGQIVSCSILSNYLILVVKRGTEVSLERLRLETTTTGTLNYRVHLDRLVSVTGVYDLGTHQTTWTLPYSDTSTAFTVINSTDGYAVRYTNKNSNTTIVAPGDFSAHPCWVGKTYTKRYRFSEWKVKADGTNVGLLQGRLQVRNITLGFINTGDFKLEVTPSYRQKVTYPFNGERLNIAAVLGSVPLATGDQRFPVLTNPAGATIDIVNDSHLPSCFHTASYEGFFTVRSRTQ